MLAAVPPRADPRDGLVGCALADLPPGGLIATGSARRRAQLAYARPDLSFTEIRGNMERRVSRGEDGSVAAVVVAVAAMERLGWMHRLTDILDPIDVLPQAGQGAIAVQCRTDDDGDPGAARRHRRRAIPPGRAGRASRSWPAWGEAARCPSGRGRETTAGSSGLRVHGLVASGDGRVVIRMARRGDDPELVGAEVARALLVEGGGSGIDGFDAAALSGRGPSAG